MPRVVVDTGVVVSWMLYPFSIPAQAVEAVIETGVILISDEMQRELIEVLSRPKFTRYAAEEEIEAFIRHYTDNAEYIPVTSILRACADPDDDKVLAAAVSGRADFIVSSDLGLLDMHPFRHIKIVTPRDFLDQF